MKTLSLMIPTITLLIATSIAHAGNVRVVATGENWVEILVDASDLSITSESPYDRIDIPGWTWLHQPGAPAVPVRGATLGMPYGSRAVVQVLDANYEEIEGLDLRPVPQTQLLGSEQHPFSRSIYLKNEAIYDTPGFYPGAEAVVAHTGILRDQQIAILSLRPVQYDPVQRRLRIARQMRVRVLFITSTTRPPIRLLRATDGFEPIYQKGLLNPEQARLWRGRRIRTTKRIQDWYDPTATYYKIRIFEDGLYRLDARWFSDSGIVLTPGDLDRLQIFLDGEEIPLLIEDGGDGVLDEGDGVLFWGAYRRVPDRDFESEYGTERVYFLRIGRESGLRYKPVEDAPAANAVSTHFLSRKHVEIDSTYEALGHARNANRDHWFWRRTASPSRPGDMPTDVVMPVPLPGLAREASGNAQIRLGMHSLTLNQNTNPDHYAVIQIQDGPIIAEARWDGQAAHIATGTVPVSALSDTTYVVLRTPGDPSFPTEPIPYVDHVFFNWVEITYPRHFEAVDGMLRFNPGIVLSPRAISIANFEHERVRVLNLQKNKIIGTVQDDEGIRFEIAENGDFVALDETAIKTPERAERDIPADLRGFSGAEYIIIAGADFMDAAERLAAHRQGRRLSTLVVNVADVYDEFSFGQVDAEAIRRFVHYGFHTWSQRPEYVLLFGEFSFDYRNLFGENRIARHNLVPGMPFQSPNRGLAFTDEFFGRVDDDLFMDVFVGRFSVRRASQANTVVQKVIAYDETPSAQWRNRITLMANWDAQGGTYKFIAPSDTLAKITQAIGLENFKVYHDANTPPEPNASSREVIRQINEGRLIVNFMGHGSASSMSKFIAGSFQQGAFNYMSQIQNRERLPLFIGMSCLNGLYWDPRITSLAEEMTNKYNGGAIAYISSSSLSFIRINNQLNTALFRHIFENGVLAFGESLALGKMTELAALPSSELGLVGMNLIGDPAQKIAVPQNPDFVLGDAALQLDQQGELTTGDSVRVTLRVDNWGTLPKRSVDIVLIDRNLNSAEVDTLFMAALPPFGIRDSVTVLWRLKNRPGRHILEAIADPANAIAEGDETNNRTTVEIDVLGALSAVPFLPLPSQTVANAQVVLGVRSGEDQFHLTGEFELSTSNEFQDAMRSGNISAAEGIILWRPTDLHAGSYFWRARLSDGQTTGPWSDIRHFVVTSSVPERQVVWQQDGAIALSLGTGENVVLSDDGSVGRTMSPPPIRFNAAEASFLSEGVTGAAVLCTDGTYLYVKRFYTPQDRYPGSDLFARIGTGFNGTVAGQNYGIVTETPIQGISATFHSDGFIYAEHQTARSLLRISPVTGRIDTVEVPGRLLDLYRGLPFDAHALITSDGEFIYNVSAGVNGIRRAGWSVRVFDPANAWRVVRQFAVPPTETGFGYLYTDGAIADGRFIYLIEFGTGLTHRVRVVDAHTGAFVEEFESDQAQTDILGGQFDWVNNAVWLGQLRGGMVYRYPGQSLPEFGTLTSGPIGPASAWHTVTTALSGTGKAEVNLLGEIDNNTFAPLAQGQNLPPGIIDLRSTGSSVPRLKIQIKLYGEGLNPSPGLQTWTATYQPISDIGLSNLRAEPFEITELQPVYLHLDTQNRGPLDLALGASVAFYSGAPALGRLIGRVAVPENSPLGQIVPLRLTWQTAQWAGQHMVTARLENFQGQPIFPGREIALTEPVRIAPSTDRDVPTIEIAALDALGEVRPEDYLPSQPTFRISMRDTAGIDLSSIRLSLSGTDEGQESNYESDNIKNRAVTPMTLSFVYTPNALADGDHTLNIEAFDRLGNGPAKVALSFQVSSILAIENALVAPNPVSDTGHFTFILSRPSEVTVRIYTLAGRLVQRIEEPFARAGYNQIFWDGRDADGQMLSNNTYLYTVTADNGESQARVKDKLIVYR